jgi:hypothetical protein
VREKIFSYSIERDSSPLCTSAIEKMDLAKTENMKTPGLGQGEARSVLSTIIHQVAFEIDGFRFEVLVSNGFRVEPFHHLVFNRIGEKVVTFRTSTFRKGQPELNNGASLRKGKMQEYPPGIHLAYWIGDFMAEYYCSM